MLVHLLSLILAMCPAHLPFFTTWTMSFTQVLILIHVNLCLSPMVIPNIALSIALCVILSSFFVFLVSFQVSQYFFFVNQVFLSLMVFLVRVVQIHARTVQNSVGSWVLSTIVGHLDTNTILSDTSLFVSIISPTFHFPLLTLTQTYIKHTLSLQLVSAHLYLYLCTCDISHFLLPHSTTLISQIFYLIINWQELLAIEFKRILFELPKNAKKETGFKRK